MSTHRFQQFLQPNASQSNQAPVCCGFMVCPMAIAQMFSVNQLSMIQEIYRLAQERIESQKQISRRRLPAFSLN
jgi:hypothetical protein